MTPRYVGPPVPATASTRTPNWAGGFLERQPTHLPHAHPPPGAAPTTLTLRAHCGQRNQGRVVPTAPVPGPWMMDTSLAAPARSSRTDAIARKTLGLNCPRTWAMDTRGTASR